MIDKVSIMNKARLRYRQERCKQVVQRAIESFEQHKKEPLFIIGVSLYWAEGKTSRLSSSQVELSNSDPQLLRLFCAFLRRYIEPNNSVLRARLFLYPDLNEDKMKLFWSRNLGIPRKNFIRSHHFNTHPRITKKKSPYGTCSVYINNSDARLIIDKWIESIGDMRR
jgi:hypothetical protein